MSQFTILRKLEENIHDIGGFKVAALRNPDSDTRPTICLHGWMDNAYSFLPLFEQLDKKNLILIDFPGHGHSDGYAKPYTMENYCAVVLEIINQLLEQSTYDKVDIIGHSLGGVIASLLCASFPELFHKSVFIEAIGPLVDTPENTVGRLRSSLIARQRVESQIKEPRTRFRKYKTLKSCINARVMSGDISYSAAETLAARGVKEDGGFYWTHDRFLKVPSSMQYTEKAAENILSLIENPVLILRANNTLAVIRIAMEKRLSYLKNVVVKEFDGNHHLHMEDASQATAGEIFEFLK